jgi:predicted membrane GTPase involved in stress response
LFDQFYGRCRLVAYNEAHHVRNIFTEYILSKMVLSGSKRVSSLASIKNQNQGGGSSKAGIPPRANVGYATEIAYQERGKGLLNMKLMTRAVGKEASQSRPIGVDVKIVMH